MASFQSARPKRERLRNNIGRRRANLTPLVQSVIYSCSLLLPLISKVCLFWRLFLNFARADAAPARPRSLKLLANGPADGAQPTAIKLSYGPKRSPPKLTKMMIMATNKRIIITSDNNSARESFSPSLWAPVNYCTMQIVAPAADCLLA